MRPIEINIVVILSLTTSKEFLWLSLYETHYIASYIRVHRIMHASRAYNVLYMREIFLKEDKHMIIKLMLRLNFFLKNVQIITLFFIFPQWGNYSGLVLIIYICEKEN